MHLEADARNNSVRLGLTKSKATFKFSLGYAADH
jgi:hypothetical protein